MTFHTISDFHTLTKTPETLPTEECNKIQEHHFESNVGQEFEMNKVEASGIKRYHSGTGEQSCR